MGWREALPGVFHSDLCSGASDEGRRRPCEKNTSPFWYAKNSVRHNSLNEDFPSSGFGDKVFCQNEVVAHERKQWMLAETPESTWAPHVRPLFGDLAVFVVCSRSTRHCKIILSEYKLLVIAVSENNRNNLSKFKSKKAK